MAGRGTLRGIGGGRRGKELWHGISAVAVRDVCTSSCMSVPMHAALHDPPTAHSCSIACLGHLRDAAMAVPEQRISGCKMTSPSLFVSVACMLPWLSMLQDFCGEKMTFMLSPQVASRSTQQPCRCSQRCVPEATCKSSSRSSLKSGRVTCSPHSGLPMPLDDILTDQSKQSYTQDTLPSCQCITLKIQGRNATPSPDRLVLSLHMLTRLRDCMESSHATGQPSTIVMCALPNLTQHSDHACTSALIALRKRIVSFRRVQQAPVGFPTCCLPRL
jgi:hypothetical protein